MLKEAMLYRILEGQKLSCDLCSHRCEIVPEKYGICGVRQNREGKLFTHVYGEVIAAHVDPIEKKPLYHYLPGSTAFSVATIGCNFQCPFCQNWQISHKGAGKAVTPQALAAMIKDLDPYHPTMTVTAEIGGQRIRAVHTLCPDIDIMGINSYGGLPTVPQRYRKLGGTKPIVITEFGPPGTWEIAMTGFGVPPELTSTEKAAAYRDAFTAGCLEAGGLCLGGFAFFCRSIEQG